MCFKLILTWLLNQAMYIKMHFLMKKVTVFPPEWSFNQFESHNFPSEYLIFKRLMLKHLSRTNFLEALIFENQRDDVEFCFVWIKHFRVFYMSDFTFWISFTFIQKYGHFNKNQRRFNVPSTAICVFNTTVEVALLVSSRTDNIDRISEIQFT